MISVVDIEVGEERGERREDPQTEETPPVSDQTPGHRHRLAVFTFLKIQTNILDLYELFDLSDSQILTD